MPNEEKKLAAAQTKGAAVKRSDKKAGFFSRIAKWFRELRSELKKVVWPTPKQIVKNTSVALFVMVVAAALMWGFDWLATGVVKAWNVLGG